MTAPSPAAFRTILFDLDGTLIDSIALILASYRHTILTHRGTALPDEVWLEGLGTPLRAQFRRLTSDPAEVEAMVTTYRDHNLANHDAMVRAYGGVLPAVAALAAGGRTLAVVTSKLREGARRGLRHCGLDRYFPVVVGADDVERHKPDPEPVLKALEMLDADARTAIFVGDSPHDMAAGRAAGVAVAAALWGPFARHQLQPWQPDRWLERPGDLVRL
jgi:pyrophosphatase PpaX